MNLQCSSIFMLQRLLASLILVILCSLFSPATADATVGGPDDGGYVFVDSLEAQCDTTFTDISNTGTPLDLFYDGGRHIILPFDFTFYGQTSADVYIRNEGFVLFDTTDFGTIYTSDVSLPTPIIYRPGWFPYWDELAHDTGNVYYETLGTEPNRQFIVQWHNRPHLFLNFGGTVTFQLVLYENTNKFDFVYDDVIFNNAIYDSGASATIGIQNTSGSSYLQYSYLDETFFNQGLTAICFVGGLSLTNNVNADQALPGDSITYTLRLENKFNRALGEVMLIDTLPASFTVTSVISSGLSITETSTQPYTWQVGDMQPGNSGMITIVGTIDDDSALLGTTLTNTAYITGNGMITSQPITATVHLPLPDLSGSYKIAPPFTRIDQPLNYQIILTNSTIITATDIILTDPIPTNTVYITGSVTGATYNPSLDQIEWSGDIGPRSEITLTYAVSITSQSATAITNTATLIHTYLSAPLSISTQSETFFIKSVTENFCIDFEEGVLPTSMTTSVTTAGTATGRAQVEAKNAHNGDYALHLDTDSGGASIYTAGYTTQAATLFLDMSAVTDAELSFWIGRHNDEYHSEQDGLFISDDGGATYSQIFTFHESRPQYHNYYYKYSVDLSDVIASRGMTLTQNILLKFQSYDNGPISNAYESDGFSIDDICITAQPAEIEVQENDAPIANSIGTQVDYADFGETAILVGSIEHTFTIHNTGTGTLFLEGIEIERSYDESYYSTAHEDFEVVQPPLTEVLSGLSSSFRVAFRPTVVGLRQAIINIFSNDEDESLYRFGIRGSGVISPLINDGSTIKILSTTYVVEGSPIIGYGNISFDVEGIDLSNLEDARFEIKYDPTTFSAFGCDSNGLQFELIQCNISHSTGRIQIHVKASIGVSGDELLTRLILKPQTNDGIGILQIVPTLLMNGDNGFVEPVLEHGLITFVSELEPTEVPTETPVPIDTATPMLTDTPVVTPTITSVVTPTITPIVTDTPSIAHTATLAPIDTPIPTDTVTSEPTDTLVPTETITQTITPVPTDTPVPTETATQVPTDTATAAPTNTPVPTDTATTEPTDTPVPTDTATVIPTDTSVPTDTLVPTQAATEEPTETPVPTNTMTEAPTNTSVPTDTVMPTSTAVPTMIPSATVVPTSVDVPTDTPTDTPQPTATMTATPAETATLLPTETATPLPTNTATLLPTETATLLPTVTHTPTLLPAKLAGEIRASQTVFQRGSQIRYDLSIENEGETMAENVKIEITIPNGLSFVEDQPLPWQLQEGRNNARQNAGSVYELSLGDLAPLSTTDDKFILLSVADDLPNNEDVEIAAPGMTIVADGDVEQFTADTVAGTNIIIEADEGGTPTNLEDTEELSIKLFLPIIER